MKSRHLGRIGLLAACAFAVACAQEALPVPPPPSQEPRDTKLEELDTYIEALIGRDSVDCGTHLFSHVDHVLVRASEQDLQRSRDCAIEMSRARKAFRTYVTYPGDESFIAYGLAGTTNGQIYLIEFAGAPGGDTSDPGRFSIIRCEPPITITEGPWRRYWCAQSGLP